MNDNFTDVYINDLEDIFQLNGITKDVHMI